MRYALLCLALAGCTQTFSHPMKSDAEFKRDWYECERDAAPMRDGIAARGMMSRCMEVKGWTNDTPWYAR